MRPWFASCLLIGFACSPAKPPATPPSPRVVTITATDYAFAAPDTIVAGFTTFRLENHEREPHQAVIFGAPGKTFAELEAVAVPKGSLPVPRKVCQ